VRGRRQIVYCFTAVFLAAVAVRAQNVSGRLDFSDSIRMVDCDPASTVPLLPAEVQYRRCTGRALPAQLPAPEKLAENISVQVGEQAVTPFYAVASAGDKQAVRGRVALVLIDISGSMNSRIASGQTRFEAAKAALSSFLDGFQDGIDRFAVVPFESHQVESTIRAARFASTKQEALQQIQALPQPESRNNTGLYSAVATGLDVFAQELAKKGKDTASPEALMVLMTDGRTRCSRAMTRDC